MAMVGRLLQPKNMTDEAFSARDDPSRTTGHGRAKAAKAGHESSINDTLNKACQTPTTPRTRPA
jgi:hypothetical protein